MVTYPKDWTQYCFNDFLKVKRGASPRPIEYYITKNAAGVNWIKIGDARKLGKYIESTKEKITESGAAQSVKVYPGDFLLSNSMSFGRPYILRLEGCIHDGWLRLFDYQETADDDYLYYLLSSDSVQNQYKSFAAGSGVQNLNKEVVKKVEVCLPPLPEQESIVEILSCMDDHIVNLRELIEKKKGLRDGALEDLISGRTRLKGFNGEWFNKPLGELGVFSKGQGISRSQANSGSIPCIRYGEIYTQYNVCVKKVVSGISSDVASQSLRIRKGDLLMTASGETKEDIGKCVVYYDDKEAFAGGDIIIMKPDDSIDSLFLAFVLNSKPLYAERAKVAQGDAIVHISAKSLKLLNIFFPSDINEQREIAGSLILMDEEIIALEEEKDKMLQIKAGAMDDLLTGRIRLTRQGG